MVQNLLKGMLIGKNQVFIIKSGGIPIFSGTKKGLYTSKRKNLVNSIVRGCCIQPSMGIYHNIISTPVIIIN
jgi:hypothetical protein